LTGIARYAVSNKWIDIQRQFLQFVAPEFTSIIRLVRSLGDDGLRIYCKRGYLPKNQIEKLEAVEPYLPDMSVKVEPDNNPVDSVSDAIRVE